MVEKLEDNCLFPLNPVNIVFILPVEVPFVSMIDAMPLNISP